MAKNVHSFLYCSTLPAGTYIGQLLVFWKTSELELYRPGGVILLNVIVDKPVHPYNTLEPKYQTLSGKVISTILVQYSNAPVKIFSTLFGITTLVRLEQCPRKPISVSPSGMIMLENEQYLNASVPILFIELGKLIETRLIQLQKAYPPISCTLSGIFKLTNFLQSLKALEPIEMTLSGIVTFVFP